MESHRHADDLGQAIDGDELRIAIAVQIAEHDVNGSAASGKPVRRTHESPGSVGRIDADRVGSIVHDRQVQLAVKVDISGVNGSRIERARQRYEGTERADTAVQAIGNPYPLTDRHEVARAVAVQVK